MERLTEWIENDGRRIGIVRQDLRTNGHEKCCTKLAMMEDLAEKYSWHHRPPEGWTMETLPDVGADITIASIFCLKSGKYTEYNSVIINERCECYGNDDYVCEMKDVDMWMYIPPVEEF